MADFVAFAFWIIHVITKVENLEIHMKVTDIEMLWPLRSGPAIASNPSVKKKKRWRDGG